MHNFGTVVRFEITRSLKKKSFWIMAIGFPLMFALIGGIIFMSNKATDDASKELEKQAFSLEVTDNSGLIKDSFLSALKATTITDKQQGIADVTTGKVDAYFYYPADLSSAPIEVYGKEVGMFDNGKYTGVANSILKLSVNSDVSPEIQSVVAGATNVKFIAYKDGVAYDGLREAILPGVFLVLFYILIAFFGNQMLTSTTEEKENRIIEMILTTIEARTLIIGKIISLVVLALIQALIIFIPVLIGYLLLHDKLNMPTLDLSSLPVNGMRIGIGAAVFTASFLLFTGLLVAIGSAVPTAKEAGGFFGIVMMLIFGPLYALPLFISNPDSPFVQFLSIFPFTAPIPLLLRNAVGNLTISEALLSITLLMATAAI
ncbi:ABC transporter permease, partial [Microbacteriaceae bacterium]|nr:ABC transporter permease [Candidatus Saccharibacteria bacterium]